MSTGDWINLGISIFTAIAALSAVAATAIALKVSKRERELARFSGNISLLAEAERMMLRNPSLLQLHGISEDVLSEVRATPEEVVCLLGSFEAALLYWRDQDARPISLSPYRLTLLNNPKVRAIWSQIIRPRFMGECRFTDAVDAHIRRLTEQPAPGENRERN